MFAGRAHRQSVPVYVRRPIMYVSGRRRLEPSLPVTVFAPPATAGPVALSTAQVPAEAIGNIEGRGRLPVARYASRLGPLLPGRHRAERLPRAYDRRTVALYAMAALVFVLGLGVSLNGWRTNHAVATQVAHLQQKTAQAATSAIGTGGNAAVPSAAKPSAASVANYAVSPNLPRYIDIPALGVHARVLSEGVSSKNQLQVPWNIYDTGWYNASAQPGQQGAMLIDGHSGINGLKGVFYKLGSLSRGDQITITRGDGQKFTYTVLKVQVVGVDDVNMQSMVVSADANAPGLNLITCTGDQIPGTDQLNERVQVYAAMR